MIIFRKPKREINQINSPSKYMKQYHHVEHNKAILRSRGFRIFKGWDRYGPNLLGTDSNNQRIAYDWEDHLWMRRNKEVPVVYVTEPYPEHVDGKAITELAELIKKDWHVQISEGLSIHNPGQTVPIWITQNSVITDYDLLDSYTNCGEDCIYC